MTEHRTTTEWTFRDEIHSLAPAPARPRPRFRRGRQAIEAAAAPATYAIADCGWGFEVLRDGASIGWVAIGDTKLLPPEYRTPGFTVYPDAQSSDPLAESADLAEALGYHVPEDVATRLARGIVGREVFQVAWPLTGLPDDLEQDWRSFWIYDPDSLTLTGTRGLYTIPLESLTTSARMLNAIFQVRSKPWCDATVAGMLLAALQDLIRPQARLCSWGEECGPIVIGASIGERPPIS